MAASMKGIDPRLKSYLREHKLPDIYEALLTGLAVMCPDDPLQFLLDKLGYLKESGTEKLNWDLFVEEYMKPVRKIITESNLDFIFNMDDESFIDYSDIPLNIQKGEGHFGGRFKGLAENDKVWPTPQMYAVAYAHYNQSLKNMCFSAWMQYYLHKRNKKMNMRSKLNIAVQHHSQRLMRVHLDEWKEWMNYRKGCQAMAYQKIQKVYHVVIGHIYFSEWRTTTKVAKQQREYFERLEHGEKLIHDDGEEEGVGDARDHITLMANREVAAVKLTRGENMDEDEAFSQGTGEAYDQISRLDRQIAVKIFSYVDIADLARCACVCRSWKVIMQASSLWSRLDFFKVKHRVTDKVTTRLMSKCRPYLIHLNLRGCPLISQPTFTSISECRNLQDVNFSECKGLNDETLKTVVKGCKILLYLNVSHTAVTDSGLRTISKYCQNVQYLSIAFCKKFTDRGMLYLASGKNNKKLEYVDLSGCLQITPLGFKNFAMGCVNVQQLYLNEFPTLNDECMLAVAEKCTNIHTISLLGSPLLTDESFKKLAHSKKLKKVRIEGNHRISDASLKAIGRCTNLEHIYVADCERLTDASMKQLAACKKLKVVNFADVVRITDSGVKSLIEGCSQTLQELNLTNCIRVGDMSMFNINKKCSNLTYLSVCFCEHITEAGIDLLGQIHSLTSLDISGCNCGDNGLSALGNNIRLRDVTLSECTAITDLGLQKFTQQCKELERLDLSHCMLITDGAIKNLAFCCRNLNVLNLAGCKLLTDSSVQYLSGVCHYLTWLDISGCYLITNKALSYLKKGCKKLHTLIIKYCKGIQKPAAQKIMKHVRTVEYNNDEVPFFYGYY